MTATDTYLLDEVPVDLDRLINVAAVLAQEVRSACERAGLQAGGRALDVGCGPAAPWSRSTCSPRRSPNREHPAGAPGQC